MRRGFVLLGATCVAGLLLVSLVLPSVSVATSDQLAPKQVPTVPPRTPASPQPTVIIYPLPTPGAWCAPWGDANGDNCVNIYDLVLLSQWYGRRGDVPVALDLNADGAIDIFDLVIVTICFNQCR